MLSGGSPPHVWAGPTSPPSAWATADARADAVQHAASAVTAEIKPLNRTFRWGSQLDVRRITMTGDLTEQAVAAYIAKYATKAAECVGTLDRRIQPLDDLAELQLIQWAHM